MKKSTYSRFACPKIAIFFTGSFQAVLFFFLLTYAEIKAFNWPKAFFLLKSAKKESLEKTAKKRFFREM